MASLHPWKLSTLAAATAVCLGMQPQAASAIALGRLTVLSAMGEPLRAEIEVPQISTAEADTLRTQLGTVEQFKAQGLDPSTALNGLQIQLQRRVGGQAILQLRTDRAITEPFLDLVLDAQWQNGRLVRSYTLLLDPPADKRTPSLVRMAPQAPSLPPPAPSPIAPPPTARQPTEPSRIQPATTPITPRVAATAPASAPARDDTAGGKVTVEPGQTATQIANRHRPTGVSLDQMLLALLQGNPHAFIEQNVNKIKAGATLTLPDSATAQAIPPEQARQALVTHSTDFHTYRRELSAVAPHAAIAPPGRSAAGPIQARVEEKKAAPPNADKLMLSRNGIRDQDAVEAQLAKDKQAREAQARVDSLHQNIAALNQAQQQASGSMTGTPDARGTGTPAGTVPPTVEAPPAGAPSAPASPPPAAGPATPPSVAAPAGVAATPPTATGSLWSRNPLLPFAAGSLSALLLSYGVFRLMQAQQSRPRKNQSFLEQATELPLATKPADLGPQAPATAPVSVPVSEPTMDRAVANDSVDPVAEADVYLAYGREQQAEDILNEARARTPQRTAILVKLAEIHALRRDRKALEGIQEDIFRVSQGEGPDWERVQALVQSLETGVAAQNAEPTPTEDAPPPDTARQPPAAAEPAMPPAGDGALPPMEFDYGLSPARLPSQVSGQGIPPSLAPEPAASPAAPTPTNDVAQAQPREAPQSLLSRMDLPSLDLLPPSARDSASAATAVENAPDTGVQATADLPLREPETVSAPAETIALDFAPMGTPVTVPDSSNGLPPPREARPPLELDLQGLALELDSLSPPSAVTPENRVPTEATTAVPEPRLQTAPQVDRLSTKLALAEEFKAIGDVEGTRSLLQEVASEASGELQARAQRMLAELG